jgi:hypothetical protein
MGCQVGAAEGLAVAHRETLRRAVRAADRRAIKPSPSSAARSPPDWMMFGDDSAAGPLECRAYLR